MEMGSGWPKIDIIFPPSCFPNSLFSLPLHYIYLLCPGIKVTLDAMPDNGVILAVTDAGTHKKELERSIRKKSREKNVKIFFAFSPSCQALCEESMPVYNRLSEGRMFNQTDFDQESFFKSLVFTVCNQKIIFYLICLALHFTLVSLLDGWLVGGS